MLRHPLLECARRWLLSPPTFEDWQRKSAARCTRGGAPIPGRSGTIRRQTYECRCAGCRPAKPVARARARAQDDTRLPDRKRWREVEVVLASQKEILLRLKPIIVSHGIESICRLSKRQQARHGLPFDRKSLTPACRRQD